MRRPTKKSPAKKTRAKKPAARKPAARRQAARKAPVVRKAKPAKRTARKPAATKPAGHHSGGPVAPPVFKQGDRVAVAMTHPPGHRRTPFYIRGKSGTIERYCGAFPNPEELAYGFHGLPRRHLYRVRFRQADIWPSYKGPAQDTLDLEVYEHWLSRA